MKTRKTPSSQNNFEKEQQSWRYHAPCFQTILQTYSHQNSMVLAQKHIDQWNRIDSLEMNAHYVVNKSMTKEARLYNEEKTVSSINDVEKMGLFSHTTHKNKLKMD